ncbi:MAG: matrixin family metalloprotease [Desulfurellaceae bacterium]|nr:matrixin family metalloprotease [Desulfurellaceae bacterium]
MSRQRWLFGPLAVLLLANLSHGWVQTDNYHGYGKNHWRQKRATLNLRLGCPDDAPCWDAVAREAAEEWNDAGSRFRFRFLDPTRPGRLSCTRPDTLNTVLWSARNCEKLGKDALAITASWTNTDGSVIDSDVVFNTAFEWDVFTGPDWTAVQDFRRVALHEFGHVLGLDHPDEQGQRVAAIMNAYTNGTETLQDDDIAGVQTVYGVDPNYDPPVVGFLGNPGHRSFRSGVGVISGWICDAEKVEVQIGTTRHLMAYGTERPDTAYTPEGKEICGDTDNGFVTLFNYNRLGDGTHTAGCW